MPRFIETICFERGTYPLLHLHQQRMDKAFAAHFPGTKPHSLSEILPQLAFDERYKVRVVYDAEQTDVEFSEHVMRRVESLKVIQNDQIEYSHKYEDRSELQALFDIRGKADEIIIIKNGMVTDSFYANLAFWDGRTWYTPKTYLLNGVRKQQLLSSGDIEELSISKQDIASFEKVSLINALVDLDEISVPTSAIW